MKMVNPSQPLHREERTWRDADSDLSKTAVLAIWRTELGSLSVQYSEDSDSEPPGPTTLLLRGPDEIRARVPAQGWSDRGATFLHEALEQRPYAVMEHRAYPDAKDADGPYFPGRHIRFVWLSPKAFAGARELLVRENRYLEPAGNEALALLAYPPEPTFEQWLEFTSEFHRH
jgi:hypothetical protein